LYRLCDRYKQELARNLPKIIWKESKNRGKQSLASGLRSSCFAERGRERGRDKGERRPLNMRYN